MPSPHRPPRILEQAARDDVEAVARLLVGSADESLPEDLKERAWCGFVQRIERGERAARPRRRGTRLLGWAVASAAAAALAAVVLRPAAHRPEGRAVDVGGVARLDVGGRWSDLETDAPIETPATLRVRRGGMAEVALARGVSIRVDGPASVRLAARDATVESGRALHRVTPGHGRWVVFLGDYRVVVKGTQFWTGRSGDEAAVCLLEGRVEVRRGAAVVATLGPGQAWRTSERAPAFPGDLACALPSPRAVNAELAADREVGGARSATSLPGAGSGSASEAPAGGSQELGSPRRQMPPAASASTSAGAGVPRGPTAPPAPTAQAVAPATLVAPPPELQASPPSDPCLGAQNVEACYRTVAEGATLLAQNALVRLGEVRRARGDAAGAIQAWLEYRQRFPNGPLAQEADLAILETRLRQRSPLARRAAERFLEHWPRSEQAGEVHAIRGALLQRAGECGAALDDFERALAARVSPARRDEAAYGRAACLAAAGRTLDAADAFHDYVRSHPTGRFVEQAREGLRAIGATPPGPRDE